MSELWTHRFQSAYVVQNEVFAGAKSEANCAICTTARLRSFGSIRKRTSDFGEMSETSGDFAARNEKSAG